MADDEMQDLFDDEPQQENVENEENKNENEESTDNNTSKVTVKKKVVKPRFKLDAKRLCGERGICILPKIFSDVKFKGKGHETEDLNKLMSVLEHWTHRLYPPLCFDDVLQTIERLGTKGAVKVTVKKIRLDMPLSNDDIVVENEDDNVNRGIEITGNSDTVLEEDKFDQLLKEHNLQMEKTAAIDNIEDIDVLQSGDLHAAASPMKSEKLFTNEQRERMEQNRRLAKERKSHLAILSSQFKEDSNNDQEKDINIATDYVNSDNIENRGEEGLNAEADSYNNGLLVFDKQSQDIKITESITDLNNSCHNIMQKQSHDVELHISNEESEDNKTITNQQSLGSDCC